MRAAGVRRIVYLGGLGDSDAELSRHLRSYHEVGDVLRASGVPMIEHQLVFKGMLRGVVKAG